MSTILNVFGFVICIFVAFLITFGPMFYAITRDYRDDLSRAEWIYMWIWTVFWIALFAGIVALLANKYSGHSADGCADSGGVWTRVGSHPAVVGKTVTVAGDYACITRSG